MVYRLDSGRTTGGILKLRELIEEHSPELAYDFRERFSLSIFDIGNTVTWLEAVYLVSVLLRDPASWLQAARNEWDYPVSREWVVAVHNYDLHAAINSKNKAKPYPTPWPAQNTKRIGSGKRQANRDVLNKLERMNPKENDG